MKGGSGEQLYDEAALRGWIEQNPNKAPPKWPDKKLKAPLTLDDMEKVPMIVIQVHLKTIKRIMLNFIDTFYADVKLD